MRPRAWTEGFGEYCHTRGDCTDRAGGAGRRSCARFSSADRHASGLAHAAPPRWGRRHRTHVGVLARPRSRSGYAHRRPRQCFVGNRALRRQPPVMGVSRARTLSLRPGRGAQRSLHGGRHLRRLPGRHDRNVVIPRAHASCRPAAPDGAAARHLLADSGSARSLSSERPAAWSADVTLPTFRT